jgi:hypothetical protein
MCDFRQGMDWILDLFTQLGNTSHYSAIAYFHNSQITAANTKSSPACSVFNSRSLATASNSGYSSASRAQILPLHRISRNWNFLIPLSWPGISLYRLWADQTENGAPNSSSNVLGVFTDLLPRNGRLFIRQLHSNCCTRCNGSILHSMFALCSHKWPQLGWELEPLSHWLLAGSWGLGQFGNPEEGKRPPLEAATKQHSVDCDWEH